MTLLLDSLAKSLGLTYSLLAWMEQDPLATSFIAIPLSLICGIFSNMLLFVFLTDAIVRSPFKKGNEWFFPLQREIFDHLYKVVERSRVIPTALAQAFRDSAAFDMEFLLLPLVSTDKLLFLQESYWYYLEFQVNMILPTLLFALAVLAWSLLNFSALALSWPRYLLLITLGLLATIFLVLLSITAARRNYARHLQKLLNLLLGSAILSTNADNPSQPAPRETTIER